MAKKLGIGIAMFCLGLSVTVSVLINSEQSRSNQGSPKIMLIIQQQEYHNGELEIVGTARNIGERPAKDPRILLTVFDKTGQTLLVKDRTSLEGYEGKSMYPESTAPFRFSVSVPGKPDLIDGQLSVEGIPFETKWPFEKQLP